jgi:hypothetical protein
LPLVDFVVFHGFLLDVIVASEAEQKRSRLDAAHRGNRIGVSDETFSSLRSSLGANRFHSRPAMARII